MGLYDDLEPGLRKIYEDYDRMLDEAEREEKERQEELKKTFNSGVQVGINLMKEEIQKQCELSAKSLLDNNSNHEAKKERKYIVPIQKIINGKCEEAEIIVTASTPYWARCAANYMFNNESGWIVFSRYDEYECLE